MADHIGFVQFNHGNPLQTFEDLKGGAQARDHPGWQINLGQIARNNKSRRGTHPGQKHFELGGGAVLRLVQNHKSFIQGPTPHKSQWSHFDNPLLQVLGKPLGW